MNAAEFVFAFITVFGSTFVILGWNLMVYGWEDKEDEKENNRSTDKIIIKLPTRR